MSVGMNETSRNVNEASMKRSGTAVTRALYRAFLALIVAATGVVAVSTSPASAQSSAGISSLFCAENLVDKAAANYTITNNSGRETRYELKVLNSRTFEKVHGHTLSIPANTASDYRLQGIPFGRSYYLVVDIESTGERIASLRVDSLPESSCNGIPANVITMTIQDDSSCDSNTALGNRGEIKVDWANGQNSAATGWVRLDNGHGDESVSLRGSGSGTFTLRGVPTNRTYVVTAGVGGRELDSNLVPVFCTTGRTQYAQVFDALPRELSPETAIGGCQYIATGTRTGNTFSGAGNIGPRGFSPHDCPGFAIGISWFDDSGDFQFRNSQIVDGQDPRIGWNFELPNGKQAESIWVCIKDNVGQWHCTPDDNWSDSPR